MAGTQRPQKWRAFADTMRDGLSTHRAAARVDMNHKRASRLRHKVIALVAPVEAPPLGGIVEADETYFRRTKGSKPRSRRPRKRGTKNGSKRGLGKDKVPVVVARALVGNTRAVVLPGTSNATALTAVFRPMLSPGTTLCTDGSSVMRLVDEYALSCIDKLIGVAEYQLVRALPVPVETSLPTIEQIEEELSRDLGDDVT